MFYIKEIEFETIFQVWKYQLWPGRVSDIKPMSSMTYDGRYDLEIYEKYTPTFWGVFEQGTDKLAAVNSGHRTSDTMYRSRGLYTYEEFRGKGVTRLLFAALIEKAKSQGSVVIWTVPRKGSHYAYESAGFAMTSAWFDENVEFGPNCYALLFLK